VTQTWGTGQLLGQFAPSKTNDAQFRAWWAQLERLAASPSAVINLRRMNMEIDVRHILPSVHVPTLVLHKRNDCRVLFEAGKQIAEIVPGAKLVELEGIDHLFWVDESGRRIVSETQRFLLGTTPIADTDRVLATVLFTDLVESTRQAAVMGDRSWGSLLDTHRMMVRKQLQRFRGREIETSGGGFLAIFDGPARAIRCAQQIVVSGKPLGIAVRAGLHTGEIELLGSEVRGIAVHMASRISQIAGANEILASSTVKDLVAGAGLSFSNLVRLRALTNRSRFFGQFRRADEALSSRGHVRKAPRRRCKRG
jgi:class 3 adenylate cyclase